MTVPVPPPPPGRAVRRAWVVAIAVGALVIVLVLVAWRAAGWAPLGAPAPGATTTPPAAGTPATPVPTDEPEAPPATPPPATLEPETGTETPEAGQSPSPLPGPRPEGIGEIVEQVSSLRGLAAIDPLDARVVSAEELGARFAELAFAEQDEHDLELDGRLLVVLRLLDEGDDLRATVEELYRAQVLGLYVVDEKILYVGGEGPRLSAAQRITAAHEVLHALQDQAFDLDAFMDVDDEDSDGLLARLALVEGDAMLTQELWSAQFQTGAERQEAVEESRERSPSALLAAPVYVRESLLFPYREGFAFVHELFARDGFAAVDAAFADPPASTRHILRPETYLAGETHTGTRVTTDPGAGWEHASTYTFGEFDIDQWLAPVGQTRLAVTEAWDGAETRHWQRGEDDAVALALRLSTAEAAEAACTAVREWYAAVAGGTQEAAGTLRGDRDWMAITCGTEEILVGLAPDPATAQRLAGHRVTSAAGGQAHHYTGAGQP